ncbi:MAG: bifunctional UDP-N-acetylglucosamine diphosphorylase/glucosamine-1-phosphate N-acetyltransferase GlmU [Desulfovibrio sp.]|nr:bifunctional UDP-N-acetylglucosamine diphosphorylase/glucosamine-1-phosphate N-acetyltransferase GlmU [Desulfovibrio sp.]
MSSCVALVLAAGKGTRMRSQKPKVLHRLLDAPMLAYVISALSPVFQDRIFAVSGHLAESLEEAFPGLKFIRQTEQLGTGHALACALPALEAAGAAKILVLNGDAPLVTTETIESFLQKAAGADLAFASITLPDPCAYGRVLRKDGQVTEIVEAKDYDPGLYGQPSGEVNAGLYLLDAAAARKLLPLLRNDNKNGEYYLTDLIGLGLAAGLKVLGIPCGDDPSLLGVNSPAELADAEDLLAARTTKALLASGALIHNPGAARISPFAQIEPGADITAPCEIYGSSTIAAGAKVGPYCVIINSRIGQDAQIRPFCHLEDAVIETACIVGPYARLRPGAKMEEGAHAGNFVELKKTTLGKGAKANHLSYLGDAEIGANANIGAGAITCNYDGQRKFRTTIGEKAFIGSNSALVAPVAIGAGALVGAGSVITEDVPPDALALARGRQANKPRKK